MKALTLHQPYATLVALGVKTIETRSWATTYRGPIAIHAGNFRPGPGTHVDHWQVAHARAPADAPWQLWPTRPDMRRNAHTLPFGAIVATAALTRCVPMCDPASDTGRIPPDWALILTATENGGLRWTEPLPHSAHGWAIHNCEDQRPYGDYRPGRHAWLLADITPLDPPQPARGRQGLWNWNPEKEPCPSPTT